MIGRPIDVQAVPAAERCAVAGSDLKVVRAARTRHECDLGELRRRHEKTLVRAFRLRHAVKVESPTADGGVMEKVDQRVAIRIARAEKA